MNLRCGFHVRGWRSTRWSWDEFASQKGNCVRAPLRGTALPSGHCSVREKKEVCIEAWETGRPRWKRGFTRMMETKQVTYVLLPRGP